MTVTSYEMNVNMMFCVVSRDEWGT